MKTYDYKFNIGDEVITIDGNRGVIVEICDCNYCKAVGFLGPVWMDEEGGRHWIGDHDAKCDFQYYYKIGKYHFAEFLKASVERDIKHHESALAKLRKQLEVINELEEEN